MARPQVQRFDLFMRCNIPGAGAGYVASKDIERGTLLLEEYPMFRLPDGATESDVQVRLAQQPRGVQDQFMALFIGHQYLNDGQYLGRFRANALPCGTEGGRRVAGLLPLAARFNHSCSPNITHQWDQENRVMRFYANSEILRAQELCISYDPTSLLDERTKRQERLLRSSGFLCRCPACINESSKASDDRRMALFRAIIINPKPGLGETHVAFLRRRHAEICNAFVLLQQERLSHFRETLYFDGHRVCEEAGDRNNAMLWLKQASAAAATVGGQLDAEVANRLEAARTALLTPSHRPQILICPLP